MQYQPLFTIIIATYNAETYLQRALESIKNQSYKNFELIVVDGASNDTTCTIIENNKTIIDYFISEKDNGIYDAWNKGVSRSKGDWILFLGADDILFEDALQQYAAFINNNFLQEADLISSKLQMVDSKDNILKVIGEKWVWPSCLYRMNFAHPGSLHSKHLFKQVGLYNIDYKICGDFELLLRKRNEIKSEFMNQITTKMFNGGVSNSFKAIDEYSSILRSSGKCSYSRTLLLKYYLMIKFMAGKFFRFIQF